MYLCGVCKKVTEPRTPLGGKLVMKCRPHKHPCRAKANRKIRFDGRWVKPDDPGGEGMQIVREVNACPPCYDYMKTEQPYYG